MDIVSLGVGLVIGVVTGAAGAYLADKFTDDRRRRQLVHQEDKKWKDVEDRFPKLIAEMRSDFSTPDGRNVRAFFIKTSNTVMGFVSEPSFEYHTDKHPDLRPAMLLLIEHGFISDITPAGTPMYRVHEKLVDRLLEREAKA
ncbi:hypothetical protein IMZ29_03475 [Achromobacter sp. GG226]|uniref:hypothetical protein n=1 Tax=Verticiella alkaliphila TaxID=2779529 RepID=UPI001C0DBA61|nr:hypothetical protein [Verticiella sp. GG226]MBU4609641.1 hypothetical protein [Verticiella sp. GG226]